MPVITGIFNAVTGPVRHNNLYVQAPPGAGTGALGSNYKIDDFESNRPTLSVANNAISGRFDDTSYYVT